MTPFCNLVTVQIAKRSYSEQNQFKGIYYREKKKASKAESATFTDSATF